MYFLPSCLCDLHSFPLFSFSHTCVLFPEFLSSHSDIHPIYSDYCSDQNVSSCLLSISHFSKFPPLLISLPSYSLSLTVSVSFSLWFFGSVKMMQAKSKKKKQLSTCKGCRHLFLFMCQNVIWDCAYCTFLKSSNIKNVCQGSYCIMHRNRANVVSTLQVNCLMAAQRVNTLPGLVCRTRHY